MRRPRSAAGLLLALVLTACVGPAQTSEDYLGKARHSAKAAASALQTALLAVQTNRKGNMLATYLDMVISQAEDDFSSVQQQFDSIQPPHADESDRARDALDAILVKGSDTLSQLRILERRDQSKQLIEIARDIPPLVEKLNRFAQATLK
jgi:hypothetical protein